jgi:ribonuclease VapC
LIVIDTSALMALLLGEQGADEIAALLGNEESLSISAGTLAEALIVAERRGFREEMVQLLEHPAGLNFGACFAYATAKNSGARLLFVGEDFAKTDVVPAL